MSEDGGYFVMGQAMANMGRVMRGEPLLDDLDRLAELYEAATPGPWDILKRDDTEAWLDERLYARAESGDLEDATLRTVDAELIVAMHEATPKLIAALRAVQAQVKTDETLLKIQAETIEALRRDLGNVEDANTTTASGDPAGDNRNGGGADGAQ